MLRRYLSKVFLEFVFPFLGGAVFCAHMVGIYGYNEGFNGSWIMAIVALIVVFGIYTSSRFSNKEL